MRLGRLAVGVVTAALLAPSSARAQLSEPCAVMCGTTLVGTGIVFATGSVVMAGWLQGGFSTTSGGLLTWGTTFAAAVGGGVALAGNGERQERAIYSAAIGSAVGAALGLGLAGLGNGDDRTRLLASALVGAAAGVLAGGVYGALSHDEGSAGPSPSLSISIGF